MIIILVKSPHQAYGLSDIPVGGEAVIGIAFGSLWNRLQ